MIVHPAESSASYTPGSSARAVMVVSRSNSLSPMEAWAAAYAMRSSLQPKATKR